MNYTYTNEEEVQAGFWHEHRTLNSMFARAEIQWRNGAGQNQLATTVRCTFVDWLDVQCRAGAISSELANEVTL